MDDALLEHCEAVSRRRRHEDIITEDWQAALAAVIEASHLPCDTPLTVEGVANAVTWKISAARMDGASHGDDPEGGA